MSDPRSGVTLEVELLYMGVPLISISIEASYSEWLCSRRHHDLGL